MSASASASSPGLKQPPSRNGPAGSNGHGRDGGIAGSDSAAPQDAGSGAPQPAPTDTQTGNQTEQIGKSHSSALCLIPERRVWAQLQEVRCFRDKVCCGSRSICLAHLMADSNQVSDDIEAAIAHAGAQGFVRWPPHANLLYPFLNDSGSTCEAAARTAASALQSIKPFQVGVACMELDQGRSAMQCMLEERGAVA